MSVKKIVLKRFDPLPQLSKTLGKKAENLIARLGYFWNEKGELIFEETPVENSNIVQIIKYHFTKKGSTPVGYQEFLIIGSAKKVITVKPPGQLANNPPDQPSEQLALKSPNQKADKSTGQGAVRKWITL